MAADPITGQEVGLFEADACEFGFNLSGPLALGRLVPLSLKFLFAKRGGFTFSILDLSLPIYKRPNFFVHS